MFDNLKIGDCLILKKQLFKDKIFYWRFGKNFGKNDYKVCFAVKKNHDNCDIFFDGSVVKVDRFWFDSDIFEKLS